MRNGIRRGFLTLCVGLMATVGRAQTVPPLKAPTYPRSFRILPGEQTSFGFPLTKAGPIQAEIQWQGGMPLALSLVDLNGRVVANLNVVPSPARLAYNASVADVGTGTLWQIVAAYPKTGMSLPATGTATVRYPDADAVSLARLGQVLASHRKPAPSAADRQKALAKHAASVHQYLSKLNQGNLARIASYKSRADDSFGKVSKVPLAALPPLVPNAAWLSRSCLTHTPVVDKAIAGGIPTLLEVVPGQGTPGDRIVLHGKNFRVQNGLYQVSFFVHGAYTMYEPSSNPSQPPVAVQVPALVLTANAESVTQLTNGQQEFLVHVPTPPAGDGKSPCDGTASIQTSNGWASNTLPFRFQPLVPVVMDITSISVSEALMDCPIVITGVNFDAKPVVTFSAVASTTGLMQGTVSQSTSTAIYVIVPKLITVTRTACQVYVTCGGIRSRNTLTFTYVPTTVPDVLFNPCVDPFVSDVQFGEALTSYKRGMGTGDGCSYAMWCVNPGEFDPPDFVDASHTTSQDTYFGKSGYDDYFARSSLSNGWTLTNAIVTRDDRSDGPNGAYLAENGIGTSVPRVRVRWWGDGLSTTLEYQVTMFVAGPYGTSPY